SVALCSGPMSETSRRCARARIGACLVAALVVAAGVEGCLGDDPLPTATAAPDASADASGSLCEEYCQSVTGNCKDANSQYASFAECQALCAFLPPGREGVKENSVQCRLAQAKAAGSKETCAAAGPFGGDICGT